MYIYSRIRNNLKTKKMKKSVKSLVLLTIIVLVVNFTLSSQNKNDSLLAVTNNNSVSDTNKVKAFNKLGLNMLSDLRYKDAEYYFKKFLIFVV